MKPSPLPIIIRWHCNNTHHCAIKRICFSNMSAITPYHDVDMNSHRGIFTRFWDLFRLDVDDFPPYNKETVIAKKEKSHGRCTLEMWREKEVKEDEGGREI